MFKPINPTAIHRFVGMPPSQDGPTKEPYWGETLSRLAGWRLSVGLAKFADLQFRTT
jgi:hypothetical protein